jgi:hypothetical protein
MSLAEQFFDGFSKSYRYHRWPSTEQDSYKDSEWTNEMMKILDKTAKRMELRRKRTELRRMDLNWYREDSNTPVVSVEHENGYKTIWKEEIPKLLLSNADLRVLVCYPPKEKHWNIGKKLEALLVGDFQKKRFRGEFLLVLGLRKGMLTNRPKQFTFYKYALEVRARRLRH